MPTIQRSQLLKDFVRLAQWEHYFGDHGPQNPLLATVADNVGMTFEERLWFAILGMAYYHEGSAWVSYATPGVKQRKKMPPLDLPIGTLRRNLYGGRIRRHFMELSRIPSFSRWIEKDKTWPSLIKRMATVWGNGKWSSYTTAEALIDIAKLPIQPDATGFLDNPGPKKGIASLGFSVDAKGVADLRRMLRVEGLSIPVEVLETVMCNWNNLRNGAFYIGRSLDRQQSRILEVEEKGLDCTELWKARKQTFKEESLGELSGWGGLDKKRLKVYRDTGKLLMPWEGNR